MKFSEDKLQYVADKLSKVNVPFVKENNTFHIPDYAQKTAAVIVADYKPTKTDEVRDTVKLEIDKFICYSENPNDLYRKLKKREYKIKDGTRFENNVTDLEKRLKQFLGEMKSIREELPEDQLKMKRVSDLMTAYENNVRKTTSTILFGERKIGSSRKRLIRDHSLKRKTIRKKICNPLDKSKKCVYNINTLNRLQGGLYFGF